MPLINCEIELILTYWSNNCALANITVRATENNDGPPAIAAPTGL